MRSLWRIGSRYMLTAVLVTLLLIAANFSVFLYWCYQTVREGGENRVHLGRERMEAVSAQITLEDGEYRLSPEGYGILEESSFVWAMLVDPEGSVVWSHELPPEIPLHYELADIAVLSRWYLKDYPVGVWKNSFGLMIYGFAKDSFARYSLVSDLRTLESFLSYARTALLLNMVLLLALVLILAWRFYRSLKPVEQGILKLSGGETVELQEKGSVKELARRLNQTSASLREKDEKLRRRDDARTDWIAGVSHDIRTPLALITGYSDELMHDERLPGESRWKAEAIRQQSMVLKELVENLNLTSKLEYHSQPLNKTIFSPAVALRECVAEYYNQGLRETYEINLTVQREAEQERICADKGLLLRLFRNLIGNSIRHNPEGCRVVIALDSVGDTVRCRFSDTGRGIPKEIVMAMGEGEKGWERMRKQPEERIGKAPGERMGKQQEEHMTKTLGEQMRKGSGDEIKCAQPHVMGLRIANQIAAAHGGKLLFVGRKSGWYDVTLELPVVTGEC